METITKNVKFLPGITVFHAGTPVDENAKVANDATAIGIIVEDVVYPNKTATIMTAGTFNVVDGYAHSGIAISGEAANAMSGIELVDEEGKEWRFNATTGAENFPGGGVPIPKPTVEDVGKVVGAVESGDDVKLDFVEPGSGSGIEILNIWATQNEEGLFEDGHVAFKTDEEVEAIIKAGKPVMCTFSMSNPELHPGNEYEFNGVAMPQNANDEGWVKIQGFTGDYIYGVNVYFSHPDGEELNVGVLVEKLYPFE